MPIKLVAPQGDDLHSLSRRIDTSAVVRNHATRLAGAGNRLAGLLGRHWTTEACLAEADALLLQMAEDALVMRRLVVLGSGS